MNLFIIGGSHSGYLFASPKFATPILPGGMFASSFPAFRMIVAGPVFLDTRGLL